MNVRGGLNFFFLVSDTRASTPLSFTGKILHQRTEARGPSDWHQVPWLERMSGFAEGNGHKRAGHYSVGDDEPPILVNGDLLTKVSFVHLAQNPPNFISREKKNDREGGTDVRSSDWQIENERVVCVRSQVMGRTGDPGRRHRRRPSGSVLVLTCPLGAGATHTQRTKEMNATKDILTQDLGAGFWREIELEE